MPLPVVREALVVVDGELGVTQRHVASSQATDSLTIRVMPARDPCKFEEEALIAS